MESLVEPLLPLYERERSGGRAFALGLIISTEGSTYRKAGALMLIAADGDYAGVLSGGCLEGDLRDQARSVISGGTPRVVRYDMRGEDDLIWGLGLGCEGAVEILLLQVGPANHWEPLAHFCAALAARVPTAVGIVVDADPQILPRGTLVLPAKADPELARVLQAATETSRATWFESANPLRRLFVLPLTLSPKVLLLGAGPDTLPVVDLAARLGWKVTLIDHRSAFAEARRFPNAERVVLARPEDFLAHIDPTHFTAAVVMSHHFPSDLGYLKALAATSIPYVGLLGPASRRERLASELGAPMTALRARLHSPVGLPIGGRTPESVALAIVAEIHAHVHKAGVVQIPDNRAPLRPAAAGTA